VHKVCVIGDSHVGALKLGWPRINDEFSNVAVTWFAATQTLYDGLEIAHEKLLATTHDLIEKFEVTSGGLHAIDPDYDLYLICGLKLAPQHALNVRKEYWSRHSGAIPASVFETEFPDTIERELRKSQSARTLKMLHAISKAPIGLIAIPRPHEFDERAEKSTPDVVQRNRMLADAFETACRRLADASGAIFLPQPAETLSRGNAMVTQPVFAARSSGDPDRGHKNAAYGAIVLRDALSAMVPAIASFRHAVR
jgi:hypothetical protein